MFSSRLIQLFTITSRSRPRSKNVDDVWSDDFGDSLPSSPTESSFLGAELRLSYAHSESLKTLLQREMKVISCGTSIDADSVDLADVIASLAVHNQARIVVSKSNPKAVSL
jgi:hypothetical protein